MKHLVPSTGPHEFTFEPRRYWRGPVWANVNWMLHRGLLEHGHLVWTQRLQEDSEALAERSGIYEYYDSKTGEGLGGHTFAWTAALLLEWHG